MFGTFDAEVPWTSCAVFVDSQQAEAEQGAQLFLA